MDETNSKHFLSSLEMENLFQQVFGPALEARGFVFVGKRQWVRETGKGFKHLFYLYPFKPGMEYMPHGGISIDCVPRVEGGKVRVRRELKYVRVHHSVSKRFSDVRSAEWWISRDKEKAESQCLLVAKRSIPVIESSLESYDSMESILKFLKAEKIDEGASFYNHYETALAYAFMLAKLGNMKAASCELDIVLKAFDEETHAPFKQMLARITEF